MLHPLLQPLRTLVTDYSNELEQFTLRNRGSRVTQPFFPVRLHKIFSGALNMAKLQRAFKQSGVFPLNPVNVSPKFDNKMIVRGWKMSSCKKWETTPWQTEAKKSEVVLRTSTLKVKITDTTGKGVANGDDGAAPVIASPVVANVVLIPQGAPWPSKTAPQVTGAKGAAAVQGETGTKKIKK